MDGRQWLVVRIGWRLMDPEKTPQRQQRPEIDSQAVAGGLLGLDRGLRAFASARAMVESPLAALVRTYLGAGAQGPQASVTSRTKQLEHSLIISWINLLSRVVRKYREGGARVKWGRQLLAFSFDGHSRASYSLFPIPYSLFPNPCSLFPASPHHRRQHQRRSQPGDR
jgi:hypothetical protein